MLRISLTTLDLIRKETDFVAPIKFGGSLRWRADEVEAWIESKIVKDAE